MNFTKIAVSAGCILALCAGCGANDTSSSKEKASSEKSGVTKEITASVDKMETIISKLNDSAEKGDQKEIEKKGKELNSYWLSFENDIRGDYPFEYTEIEKHLQPIYTEAQKDKPDTDKIKTESESLKASLEDLTEAKKSSKKASDQLAKAADEYKDYVKEQSDQLVKATEAFTSAVKSGDIEKSKTLYGKARVYYERIEPIAESLGDLDPKIDARENDVEEGDKWTGFHKLEKAIWKDQDISGEKATADQLLKDVKELDGSIESLKLTPEQIVAGAMELLNEAGISKITGEEERYSRIDLVDLMANVEGSEAVYQTVKSALVKDHFDLTEKLDTEFSEFEVLMAKYKTNDQSYTSYDKLSEDQIRELSTKLTTLSETMSKIANVL
ncbi:iron uptake system lipoprotein EfeM [Bacillus spizizenii]|uniref:Imelysin family protein n=1 Tax=Bacillus spizizenii (strain DSM 15029 / JCM 12233 / NBRC 101239 / NRRL B-23049 / TU-B-10) TaxID=1052585 RepID=G4NY09_BACS4|nr:iron uptake system lipoprotein EfeM [Bacillus spizizenii]AEP88783.1 imelysin family protein [Bacillus spizizenii TU-B-10]GEK25092.1 putative iron uptake system component EfeM [Bacillus spizizenii]